MGAAVCGIEDVRIMDETKMSEIIISPSGLMDLENAARYLGTTVNTMRWLRRMKKLPFIRLGAKLMIKKSDLDEYIEQNTEPAITGKI